MLEAEEVAAQVSLWSLFSDRIEIHSVSLERPTFTLETNDQGESNLSRLFPSSDEAPGESSESGSTTSLAIHGLYLRDGTIRYIESGDADPLTVEAIELELTDFAPDSSCRFALSGRLFGGQNCRLQFAGNAGPFAEASIPAAGDLGLEISPAEIPVALRQKYFGTLLAEPGDASRVNLSANVEGDLFGETRGKGELSFVEFQVGPDEQRRLALEGQAPLELIANQLLGEPAIHLSAAGASLALGSGEWQGKTEFHFAKSQFKGYLNGAIRGVDINELLNAFTEAQDTMFGTAEIPDLQLSFAGGDPDALLDSVAGRGTITMQDGRIAALDVFNSVLSQAEKMLSAETQASGETEFVRLFSRWQIGNRLLQMNDILLESGASSGLSGAGSISFDHELNFDLNTTISGPVAAKLGGRPNSEGTAVAQIPVKVSGTLTAPKVRPDLTRAAKQQVKERVTDLLDSLFKPRQNQQP
jgi:uncharacterized protein involved in outer membrane biogenesis